jgi:hypothetical protein
MVRPDCYHLPLVIDVLPTGLLLQNQGPHCMYYASGDCFMFYKSLATCVYSQDVCVVGGNLNAVVNESIA